MSYKLNMIACNEIKYHVGITAKLLLKDAIKISPQLIFFLLVKRLIKAINLDILLRNISRKYIIKKNDLCVSVCLCVPNDLANY